MGAVIIKMTVPACPEKAYNKKLTEGGLCINIYSGDNGGCGFHSRIRGFHVAGKAVPFGRYIQEIENILNYIFD